MINENSNVWHTTVCKFFLIYHQISVSTWEGEEWVEEILGYNVFVWTQFATMKVLILMSLVAVIVIKNNGGEPKR